ncbi:MAG: hypothetical protein ABI591_32115 [Kofleriaceae bacterium]
MNLGNLARVLVIAAAFTAAVGSATSNTSNQPQQPQNAQSSPPPPQEMEGARALGLWHSTFGAVKIDADNSKGGLQAGAVQGVWQYQRQGADVVGYFYGTLRGNVLQFHWQEPGSNSSPPLTGEGYLQFEQTGRQYSGRWWSDKRDRVGDWNGWRQSSGQQQQPDYNQNQGYGGAQYGGQDQAYPRPQQQYPQQPQQQPQPYPNQQRPYYAPQPRPQQPNPYQPQPQQPQPQPYYPPQQPQPPQPQQQPPQQQPPQQPPTQPTYY